MSLTLLFTDGFDICDFITSTLKYPGSSLSGIFQGTIQTGVDSAGMRSIDNTGGSLASLPRSFGTQSKVIWCEHFGIFATGFTQQTWVIIGASGTPILQLQIQNDGTIQLQDGSGGLLSTTPAISLSTMYWIEMNAIYGTSAEIEVWLGLAGATPTRVIHLTGVNLGSTMPDRYTITWSSPSAYRLREDNVQVYSFDALTDRNGPAAVTGQIVGALVNSNQRLTFNPKTSPCRGLVLGVALDLCAKPVSGTPSLSGVVNERAALVVLGTQTVTDTTNTLVPGTPALFGFATYQYISMTNSAGSGWNDAQILTAQWGAQTSSSPWTKAAGTSILQAVADDFGAGYSHVPDGTDTYDTEGSVDVTQVYLEKVYDLTGKPFNCGQASYAF